MISEIEFESNNPFPLLESIEGTYQLAKPHSEKVDQYFGFQIDVIEKGLIQKEEYRVDRAKSKTSWIGLDPATLQTPYTEIRYMLSTLSLQPGDTIVDLGAGYGRMGLVLAKHYPETFFLGIESVKERAEEGTRVFRKHELPRARMLHQDLCQDSTSLPYGEIFFLYDLSTPENIAKVLEKLKTMAKRNKFTLVGRGRSTRDQIERKHPWLSQVNDPEHHGTFSLYRP